MAITTQFSTDISLTLTPEYDQSKFPEQWADGVRIRNAIRNLQAALDSYTGNTASPSTSAPITTTKPSVLGLYYLPCATTIPPGSPLNVYDSGGGVLMYRLASALVPGQSCNAIYAQTTAANPGTIIPGQLFGADFYVSGLTPGAVYYLQDTPGTIGPTPGTIPQVVGKAIAPNILWLNPAII